ncbi:PaaX family transcriptional regulator [Nocardia farcinica]|uniref:PaaX family transcriptional regulator n=1 Tax=Nocardia farcinica TaxID=37329 RepID=UPI002158C126|nr:PaaX family transcriptional regulator C-terminal domain-containing protein [Nocardia farcinica]
MFELELPQPSARSLLLTVIGELLNSPPAEVWTSVLLHVLNGLGVEEHAGRQVLARAATADWMERERYGRSVHWRLARRGKALVEEGVRRSEEYLAGPLAWDERWLILFITVPADQRTTRKRLYGGLSWLGMGNPAPGVWVTPHDERVGELRELVDELGLRGSALATVGPVRDVGIGSAEIVGRAWDLAPLARIYRSLIHQVRALPEPRGGDETLFAYLQLLNIQQRLMRRDPVLPVELLPDWIGREGAALIRDCRERWARRAHARWSELLEANSPR